MLEQYTVNFREILKKLLIAAGLVLAVIIAYKLLYFVAPFIIAFLVASMIEPLIKLMEKKLKFPRKIGSLVSLLLVFAVLGTIIGLIISKLISQISSAAKMLDLYYEQFIENLDSLIARGSAFYQWLPTEITDNIGTVISNISDSLVNIVNSIVKGAFTTAVSIPEALIFTLVTILSTYFISSDRNRISGFFKKQLPATWIEKANSITHDLFSAFFGYVKAQLIIMSVAFTELFIGFSIIGARYALLLAFATSIIDAFPILGTGTVLIPWGIYEMLMGNFRTGLSLVIMYVIVLVVRQLIEPKIVGQQIGIHPLVTLMGMYVGLKVFGMVGLILGPITVFILKNVLSGIMKERTVKDIIGDRKTSLLIKDGERKRR